MTTIADALAGARARGLEVSDDEARLALTGPPETPLAARALLGFGIWIGAALVVTIIDTIERYLRNEAVALALGVALLGLAAAASRMKRWGDVRMHLTVLAVVGAEVVLVTLFPSRDLGFALCLLALQVAVFAAVSNTLTRFTASSMAFFLGALITDRLVSKHWRLNIDGLQDPYYIFVFALAATLWLLRDRPWATRWGTLHTPLAWAASLTILGSTFLQAIEPSRWGFRWPAVATAVFAAAACVVVARFMRESRPSGFGRAASVATIAIIVLAALTFRTPWVLAGLVLIAVAHGRREAGLYAIGLAVVGVALYGHYFHGGTTLMTKAWSTGAAGVALLVCAGAVRVFFGAATRPTTIAGVEEAMSAAGSFAVRAGAFARAPSQRWSRLAIVASVSLAVGVPLGLAAQKAAVVATGDVVLLELAPRDPRSLMQGDYMVLRYRLPQTSLRNGLLRLTLDERGVATQIAQNDGTAVAENQRVVRYRKRRHGTRIGAESYFFEEGTGERYANARFGELRVAANGEVVLVGLRDAELNQL